MKITNPISAFTFLLCTGSCNPAVNIPVPSSELPAALPGLSFSWHDLSAKEAWETLPRETYDGDTIPPETLLAIWEKKNKTIQRYRKIAKQAGLPDSGIFYEYVELGAKSNPLNRAVALWIDRPRVVLYELGTKGCETELSGLGEVLGPRSLLLLDLKNERILQKIDSLSEGQIAEGFYAPMLSSDFKEMNALQLADTDGDGVAAELLFRQYSACGVYEQSILAYDHKLDQLEQRLFRLKVYMPAWAKENTGGPDTTYLDETKWVLDFPLHAIRPTGQIQYRKDIGHGVEVIYHYDFQFNQKTRCFEGTLVLKGLDEQ